MRGIETSATTWGELDSSWIGRSVIVRWEDGTDSLADGLPSGWPREWRGVLALEDGRFWLYHEGTQAFTGGFPAHALVQEAQQ